MLHKQLIQKANRERDSDRFSPQPVYNSITNLNTDTLNKRTCTNSDHRADNVSNEAQCQTFRPVIHGLLYGSSMTNHPMLTDPCIPVSTTLAATIGLNEAILLTVINQVALGQPLQQIRIRRELLRQQLPFWDDVTIRQTLTSLFEKGLVILRGPMYPESHELVLAFSDIPTASKQPQGDLSQSAQMAQPQETHPIPPPAVSNPGVQTPAVQQPYPAVSPVSASTPKQSLDATWKPNQDTLTRLQQHGIEAAFVWAQLDGFLLQAQEQGNNRNDWNTRLFRYVKNQWVYAQNDAQQQANRYDQNTFQVSPDTPQPIQNTWQPSRDARQILQRAGVEQQFIDDAIPEFVLYWSERGDAHKTWNSKFIQHIRQQWARYSASVEHSNLPLPITPDWQPAPDCFDILAMAHINPEFARARIAEFVLYWRDSGQVHNSWNSRFLQYIKQQWARQLAQPTGDNDGQATAEPGYSTAAASIQRLNDTSW